MCRDGDGESIADSGIDGLDRRILAVVQDSNLVAHRQVADAMDLSTPAVTRRLKRLRADDLIREDVSVLDPGKLERPLTIITTVVVESEKLEEHGRHAGRIQDDKAYSLKRLST